MLQYGVWHKSKRSNGSGGNNCVEVRRYQDRVVVRDSKDEGSGLRLLFTEGEWNAFIAGVKDGEFDL